MLVFPGVGAFGSAMKTLEVVSCCYSSMIQNRKFQYLLTPPQSFFFLIIPLAE